VAAVQDFAETPLEQRIVQDPDWQEGAAWGRARPGHPEGRVAEHIREVLANVDGLGTDRRRLRLIALIHDTFKHQVDRSRPRTGDNDHARIARRFAERYVDEPGVLAVVEHHDDAYRAWRRARRTGDWERAERDARALIERLGEDLALFRAFYACDNATGDKAAEPREWFEQVCDRASAETRR
jgi:hypothetical protein